MDEAESRGAPPLLELLPWDSEHFGFPIAHLVESDLDDDALTQALEDARRGRIRLVYWTTGAEREVPESLRVAYTGVLADRRATFESHALATTATRPPGQSASDCRIVPHPKGPATPRLIALGVAAGMESRFRTDLRIPRASFERLYEIWLERSTRGELADAVLVAMPVEGEPVGLVTVSVRDGSGQIGLIAVAAEARRSRIGIQLVEAAHAWMASHGANRAQVITQFRNQSACRLYASAGYRLAEVANVYHFWPLENRAEGSGHEIN